MLRSVLCLGSWCRRDIITVKDLIEGVKANQGKKRRRTEAEVIAE
jgi:hypothetical protein